MNADERDVLQYAAARLDEIREHAEQILAASAPALVYVRLAIARDNENHEGDER